MRRHVRHSILLGSAVALGVLGFGPVAQAGTQPLSAPLTIVKTVSGPVPAGTTFTVTVNCFDGAEIDDGDGGTTTATVTFDAAGQPTSADTLNFSDGPGACTVTETTTGGAATVSYSCVGVPGEIEEEPIEPSGGFSAQQVAGEPCATAGPQVAPLQVNILIESQEATVTVANTFGDPQPTPAAGVVAAPTFTG